MASTYDLVIRQGERKLLGLRYLNGDVPQDLTDWSWAAQIRERESTEAGLILDLTPYMSLNSDAVTIDLDIPATITYGVGSMGAKASWDCFIWPSINPAGRVLLVEGAASLDKATTDLS